MSLSRTIVNIGFVFIFSTIYCISNLALFNLSTPPTYSKHILFNDLWEGSVPTSAAKLSGPWALRLYSGSPGPGGLGHHLPAPAPCLWVGLCAGWRWSSLGFWGPVIGWSSNELKLEVFEVLDVDGFWIFALSGRIRYLMPFLGARQVRPLSLAEKAGAKNLDLEWRQVVIGCLASSDLTTASYPSKHHFWSFQKS